MSIRGHKRYLREICEKVDQDLNSPTCKKLREHLSVCPTCMAYYRSLKETIHLYQEYDDKLEVSHVKDILAHIEEDEGTKLKRKRGS